MSVIVTGMFMPNTCEECLVSCEVGSDMHCLVSSEPNDAVKGGLFWRKSECGFDRRPDWCPLRPLPEKHGRLIDADELEDVFYSFHHSQSAGYVQDAETIVEAEGDCDG